VSDLLVWLTQGILDKYRARFLVGHKHITDGINFITARDDIVFNPDDGGISMTISDMFPYLYS
jgi:hypothetical protein